MKKVYIIIAVLGIIIGSVANAQPLNGKYMLYTETSKDMPFTFNFTDKGEIYWFAPNAEDVYLGNWQSLEQIVHFDFEDYQFKNFEGLYKVVQGAYNNLELRGKKKKLFALPYDRKEMGRYNAKSGIEGEWMLDLADGVEKHYHFILPNIVEIKTYKDKKLSDDSVLFWQALQRGKVLMLFSEVIKSSGGLFENIELNQNTLQADFEGERLVMKKVKGGNIPDNNDKEIVAHRPIGKYLMTIQEKGKETKDAMMTAVEINKNNELIALQADGEEPEAIAQLQFSEDKVNIQFIPFLADLSGDYKIKYETHDVFSLNGTKKTIVLSPFEPDEIGNRDMGIAGKWKLKGSKKNLTVDFQLPNIVHITEKKGNLTLDEYYFWGVMPNGEDIFITASPFFNPFGGYLRQIQVKNKVLHFEYKGKHYEMSKM